MFVRSENRSRVILSKWVHRIFEMDLMKSNIKIIKSNSFCR